MDPWTLAYLAGHRDMAITKRYIHPADETVRAAIEKARDAQGGHNSGHTKVPRGEERTPAAAVIN